MGFLKWAEEITIEKSIKTLGYVAPSTVIQDSSLDLSLIPSDFRVLTSGSIK